MCVHSAGTGTAGHLITDALWESSYGEWAHVLIHTDRKQRLCWFLTNPTTEDGK